MKKITLMSAHKNMFKNYANFHGRTSRKEYWLAAITAAIIITILSVIACIPVLPLTTNPYAEISIFSLIIACIASLGTLVYVIPLLSLYVRRLHDIGKSGWFLLLGLIPYIGSIILFIFTLLDSQPSDNKYGPNPKSM